MAEIEFSVLARAYIKKRIAAATTINRRSIAREPVLAATGGRRSQTALPPTHPLQLQPNANDVDSEGAPPHA